jgi:hypothetical protein
VCLAKKKRRDTNVIEETIYPKMLMSSKYVGLIRLIKKEMMSLLIK